MQTTLTTFRHNSSYRTRPGTNLAAPELEIRNVATGAEGAKGAEGVQLAADGLLEERPPGGPGPSGCQVDSGVFEDPRHRGRREPMVQLPGLPGVRPATVARSRYRRSAAFCARALVRGAGGTRTHDRQIMRVRVAFRHVATCADVRRVAPVACGFAGFAGVSLAGPLAR